MNIFDEIVCPIFNPYIPEELLEECKIKPKNGKVVSKRIKNKFIVVHIY